MNNIETRAAEALAYAREHADSCSVWTDLHNAVFGIGGKLCDLFPSQAERTAFLKTPEAGQIRELIDGLRQTGGDPPEVSVDLSRANGNISVRMPRSLHAALLLEADTEGISLNQLVLTKLAVQLRAAVG
jgi:hypothetical protein